MAHLEGSEQMAHITNPFNSDLSSLYDCTNPIISPFLLSMESVLGRCFFTMSTYGPQDSQMVRSKQSNVIAYFIRYAQSPLTRSLSEMSQSHGFCVTGETSSTATTPSTTATTTTTTKSDPKREENEVTYGTMWVLIRINVENPTPLDEFFLYHLNRFFLRVYARSLQQSSSSPSSPPARPHITDYIPLDAARIIKRYSIMDTPAMKSKLISVSAKLYSGKDPIVPISTLPQVSSSSTKKPISNKEIEEMASKFYSQVKTLNSNEPTPPQYILAVAPTSNSKSSTTANENKIKSTSTISTQQQQQQQPQSSQRTNETLSSITAALHLRGAAPPTHEVGSKKDKKSGDPKKEKKGDKKDKTHESTSSSSSISSKSSKDKKKASESKEKESTTSQSKKKKQLVIQPQEQEEDVYAVEAIREHKFSGGQLRYRVKWSGYPESECTWEPHSNLCQSIDQDLAEYLLKHDRSWYQHYYRKK